MKSVKSIASVEINFLPITKENKSQQISQQIRQLILSGMLKAGNKLPSSRSIASELKVARGTVVTAMDILISEGLLSSVTGAGTFVSDEYLPFEPNISRPLFFPKPTHTIKANIDKPFTGKYNFRACRPSMKDFPRNAWRKAASNAASVLPNSGYDDPQGDLELRETVVDYLQRVRGLDVKTDEIIITNGAIHAMSILANIYLSKNDCVAFEDPGYPLARQVLSLKGSKIINIKVDENGMCVDDLPLDGGNIKLVYVTPSHQFPTGQRLCYPRRSKLLQWAAKHNALILEDDYAGEFRYDVPPLTPLAAMCGRNHVVYFGTFSKTLFPSLRLGYAVAPKEVIDEMVAYRTVTDYQTNTLSQLTLKYFMQSGEFEKHIHRMRRNYAKKRNCLKQAIVEFKFPGRLTGIESGLNGLIELYPANNATELAKKALNHGVFALPLSRFTQSNTQNSNALVLGYSSLSLEDIRSGIEILSSIANYNEKQIV